MKISKTINIIIYIVVAVIIMGLLETLIPLLWSSPNTAIFIVLALLSGTVITLMESDYLTRCSKYVAVLKVYLFFCYVSGYGLVTVLLPALLTTKMKDLSFLRLTLLMTIWTILFTTLFIFLIRLCKLLYGLYKHNIFLYYLRKISRIVLSCCFAYFTFDTVRTIIGQLSKCGGILCRIDKMFGLIVGILILGGISFLSLKSTFAEEPPPKQQRPLQPQA